jgi:endonuclease-3 related protein
MKPIQIYKKLLKKFGKQYWWPAASENPQFEIIIGAILTQQTAWKNVEKAIANLRERKLLEPKKLADANLKTIEKLVKPTGFYKQKARRIWKIAKYLQKNYKGNLDRFFSRHMGEIREELLSLDGVGNETADSILLYAGGKLVFPIDSYTVRLCKSLKIAEGNYEKLRGFFENSLPKDLEVYKELHALIVEWGKTREK